MYLIISLLMAQLEINRTEQVDVTRFKVASIAAYAASSEGQLVLYDGDTSALVFVSNSGKVLGRKGGKGQGPGEFQYFAAVDWLQEEKVFVTLDWGNQRLVTWHVDGTMIQEYKTPMPMIGGDIAFKQKVLFFSDATMGVFARPLINAYDCAAQKNSKIFEYDMTPLTLPRLASGGIFAPPWQAKLLFCLGKDFLAVAFSSENTVQLLDLKGHPKGSIKIAMKRFPVVEEQVKQALERLAPDEGARIRKELKLPENWPYLMAIRLDAKQRLWCFGPRQNPKMPLHLKIFDPKGQLLVTSTINYIPDIIMDGFFYCMQEDQDENRILIKANYKIKP